MYHVWGKVSEVHESPRSRLTEEGTCPMARAQAIVEPWLVRFERKILAHQKSSIQPQKKPTTVKTPAVPAILGASGFSFSAKPAADGIRRQLIRYVV